MSNTTFTSKEPLPIYYKDFSRKEVIDLLKPIVNTGKYDIMACYDVYMSPTDLADARNKLSIESTIPIHSCINIDPTNSYYKYDDPYSRSLLRNKSEKAILDAKISNHEILNIFNDD